jgi:hypothetical protein
MWELYVCTVHQLNVTAETFEIGGEIIDDSNGKRFSQEEREAERQYLLLRTTAQRCRA